MKRVFLALLVVICFGAENVGAQPLTLPVRIDIAPTKFYVICTNYNPFLVLVYNKKGGQLERSCDIGVLSEREKLEISVYGKDPNVVQHNNWQDPNDPCNGGPRRQLRLPQGQQQLSPFTHRLQAPFQSQPPMLAVPAQPPAQSPGGPVWSPSNPKPSRPPVPQGLSNGPPGSPGLTLPSLDQMGRPVPQVPPSQTAVAVRIYRSVTGAINDGLQYQAWTRSQGFHREPFGGGVGYSSGNGLQDVKSQMVGFFAAGAVLLTGYVAVEIVALGIATAPITLPAGAPAGAAWIQVGNLGFQLAVPAAAAAPLLLPQQPAPALRLN